MKRPSFGNRAAVIMSAAALIMSAGFAGGPVLARALVSNSDKVDGLHAVTANADAAKRKGKLVATKRTTGTFKTNVIPNGAKFPATVPLGVTVRGAFTTDAESVANAAGDFGGAISYGAKMPAALIVEFSPTGASTANCPGDASQPEAAAGYLCVFVTQTAGTDGTLPGVSTQWAYYYNINSAAPIGSDVYIRGVWAAHAPTSVAPRPILMRNFGSK